MTGVGGEPAAFAVALTRATRDHGDIRMGSSIRGAVDFVLLLRGLNELRGLDAALERSTVLDAAHASVSGRIRVEDGCDRRPEDLITELVDRLLAQAAADDLGPGKVDPVEPPGDGGFGRILENEEARAAVAAAARRTLGRESLRRYHESFSAISPAVGEVDERVVEELFADDPDAALALLADAATATDATLRRTARRLASRLIVRLAGEEKACERGVRRLVAGTGDVGDVDVDRSLERSGGHRPRRRRRAGRAALAGPTPLDLPPGRPERLDAGTGRGPHGPGRRRRRAGRSGSGLVQRGRLRPRRHRSAAAG